LAIHEVEQLRAIRQGPAREKLTLFSAPKQFVTLAKMPAQSIFHHTRKRNTFLCRPQACLPKQLIVDIESYFHRTSKCP
jgi:hypothetical protein